MSALKHRKEPEVEESKNRDWVEQWAEDFEGYDLILFDGLDEAIVGVATVHTCPSHVVYSYKKIIDVLMRDMSYAEAVEYFDFNISCLWAGPWTPAILYEPEGREPEI